MNKPKISQRKLYTLWIYCNFFVMLPIASIEEVLDNVIFIPLFRILCCFIILAMFIKRRMITKYTIVIFFFCALLCISTFAHGGYYVGAIYGQFFFLFSVCCFFEYNLRFQNAVFLKAFYEYCYILIIINILTIFMFPGGLFIDARGIRDTNFFLGNYNSFIKQILPALGVGYFLLQKKQIHLKSYIFLWVCVCITYIKLHSLTSIVGVLLLGSFLMFFNNCASKIIYNAIVYTTSSFFLLVVFVLSRSSILYSAIASFTGKSLTFSGRTVLWDKIISEISFSKLIGYGVQKEELLISKFNLDYAGHAHNFFLQIMYQTGILGLLFWVFILSFTVYNFLRTSNDRISRCYGCVFFALLIMSIFDFYGYAFILPLLLIFNYYCESYVGKFIPSKDSKCHN